MQVQGTARPGGERCPVCLEGSKEVGGLQWDHAGQMRSEREPGPDQTGSSSRGPHSAGELLCGEQTEGPVWKL